MEESNLLRLKEARSSFYTIFKLQLPEESGLVEQSLYRYYFQLIVTYLHALSFIVPKELPYKQQAEVIKSIIWSTIMDTQEMNELDDQFKFQRNFLAIKRMKLMDFAIYIARGLRMKYWKQQMTWTCKCNKKINWPKTYCTDCLYNYRERVVNTPNVEKFPIDLESQEMSMGEAWYCCKCCRINEKTTFIDGTPIKKEDQKCNYCFARRQIVWVWCEYCLEQWDQNESECPFCKENPDKKVRCRYCFREKNEGMPCSCNMDSSEVLKEDIMIRKSCASCADDSLSHCKVHRQQYTDNRFTEEHFFPDTHLGEQTIILTIWGIDFLNLLMFENHEENNNKLIPSIEHGVSTTLTRNLDPVTLTKYVWSEYNRQPVAVPIDHKSECDEYYKISPCSKVYSVQEIIERSEKLNQTVGRPFAFSSDRQPTSQVSNHTGAFKFNTQPTKETTTTRSSVFGSSTQTQPPGLTFGSGFGGCSTLAQQPNQQTTPGLFGSTSTSLFGQSTSVPKPIGSSSSGFGGFGSSGFGGWGATK